MHWTSDNEDQKEPSELKKALYIEAEKKKIREEAAEKMKKLEEMTASEAAAFFEKKAKEEKEAEKAAKKKEADAALNLVSGLYDEEKALLWALRESEEEAKRAKRREAEEDLKCWEALRSQISLCREALKVSQKRKGKEEEKEEEKEEKPEDWLSVPGEWDNDFWEDQEPRRKPKEKKPKKGKWAREEPQWTPAPEPEEPRRSSRPPSHQDSPIGSDNDD